ncbi:hypothetical protein MPTK1_8g08060 [Marchantia polymorpha subsp. ruderalis]|uniref:Desiccation-related protein PCC13-62 n=2 Tax=Marchantia polymorpha TaxID=3197 RepID=A0A176VW89_MARPO|nr:hypothetical protein AXG93_1163s1090 [Marchantia polymorpha subsp. ruderalis]PTQ28747.1 hypothetical protein MARPO_0155s0011 [Marchantia polymorpha]BBN19123.1 hypothetical protein Mp_8g08060 [Marchantia polymorpha subsp. ruderalis]|eukprot:PTQ28747.1 hypothetical protein MARPO_0155s0011 [Marchantia polymorpha]
MALLRDLIGFSTLIVLLCSVPANGDTNFTAMDKDLIAFALNLEYFEAEFFLNGALGYGLDKQAPMLAAGGPAPIGPEKAVLDPTAYELVAQMGLQEVGHLRAIKSSIGDTAFPRVQLDISKAVWAKTMDSAFNKTLSPPFDAYANSVNYMLASYAIPYVGLTGYTGAAPLLQSAGAKSLVARLLGVESGQDAVIRTWLYERKGEMVMPYNFTVAEATVQISKLRNTLDHEGLEVVEGMMVPFEIDDEGLLVPEELGAERQTKGNVLSADEDSLSYQRTPEQILSIVYSSGSPKTPGGFYPLGARGNIAEKYHKYGEM